MTSTETMENTLPLYELAFIIKEESGFDRAKALLSQHKAEVITEHAVTKAKLAYPIKKLAFAFFGVIRFHVSPEILSSIAHDFNIEDGFLRHMISIVKKKRASDVRQEESAKTQRQVANRATRRPSAEGMLTNADIEKKIEEISQTG